MEFFFEGHVYLYFRDLQNLSSSYIKIVIFYIKTINLNYFFYHVRRILITEKHLNRLTLDMIRIIYKLKFN